MHQHLIHIIVCVRCCHCRFSFPNSQHLTSVVVTDTIHGGLVGMQMYCAI